MNHWALRATACVVSFLAALPALARGPKPPAHAVHLQFPTGFQWCTATAAHQIEGRNIDSDWWEWELDNWGVTSGVAVDHWNRVDEDIRLMKDLNAGTYRFSVEWAKIEPQENVFDPAAILHYRQEVEKLRRAGIRPMITLHHFTFPRWVRARGGFEWSGLPVAFARFAERVALEIGADVTDWVTINEPMVHLVLGTVSDRQPPNRRGESKAIGALLAPLRGVLKTHAAGYWMLKDVARRQGRSVSVGLAHHLRVFDPAAPWNVLDRLGAGIFDHAFNWMIPEALATGKLHWPAGFQAIVGVFLPTLSVDESMPEVRGTQDYFGFNYYTREKISVDLAKDPSGWLAMGTDPRVWEIYPSGMYRLLKEIHARYPQLGVMVTENGVDDAADLKRVKFIEDHLYAMHQAMAEGVPVTGYCHWSLLDNFEWTMGFDSRFGLYSVDYLDDLKRTKRPSGIRFAEIALQNGLWAQPFAIEKGQ